MTNNIEFLTENIDFKEKNEKSLTKVINIIALYGPISISDIKAKWRKKDPSYEGRYIEGIIKYLDPQDDKIFFKRLFCWQEISSHSIHDTDFKTKLKNKILSYPVYNHYFPHIEEKLEVNICSYNTSGNNVEIVILRNSNDEKNWVRMEIKSDQENILKYQKDTFKVTYCINGLKEENKDSFDLKSKDGKLYVYAIKHIPQEYRTFITRETNHEKIYNEIEKMKKRLEKRGETMTSQMERSIWASKIFNSKKSRKKYLVCRYDINLKGFMKFFAFNESLSRINRVIDRISTQPTYLRIRDEIKPSEYEFVDFPFLINYNRFKDIFPKNFIPAVLKEISQYISTIIEEVDDFDLKYLVTLKFCDKLLSEYLCAGPNVSEKPIHEIKKENEKMFDIILNYLKNTLHYLHTFEIKKTDKRKNQIDSLINPPHNWFKTIEIM